MTVASELVEVKINEASPAHVPPAERIRWVLLLVLVATAVARVSSLNNQFGRTYEGTVCGPIVCAARNMVRYGLFATQFRYVENTDVVPRERWTFYNHHPALVPLTMAAGAALFGDEPWSYRIAPAICSILTTGLLFKMLTRKFDWPVGLAAAIIYGFCPFSWLLGDMPDVVGPHVVFFGVLTIECYSRWFDTQDRRWLFPAIISWILCAFSDWPAFVLPPVLAVHYLIRSPPRSWWRVVPFGMLSAAIMAFHFYWLTRGGDTSVYGQFFHRINGKSDNGQNFGALDYYNDAIKGYVFRTFTIPIVCLAGVYIVAVLLVAVHQIGRLMRHDTTLIMLGWGVAHVIIGFQSSHQHMWVWFVTLPGIAAAAALGGQMIWKMLSDNRAARIARNTGLALLALWFALPAWGQGLGSLQQIINHLAALTIISVAAFGIGALIESMGRLVAQRLIAKGILAVMAIIFVTGGYLKAHAIDDETLTEQPIIYSIRDLGLVIREIVPSGQGVLTSDMTDESTQESEPALWYYADRQIRNNIRSVAQLDASLGPGDYPLYYHLVQQGGPAPLWFVMPAEHRVVYPELTAVLDQRYAHWFIKGYMVYYFGETPAEQASKG